MSYLKNKVILIAFSVLAILCIVICFRIAPKEQINENDNELLFVSVAGSEAETSIHPYNANGDLYVFLPSYADMSKVYVHTDRELKIGDKYIKDGYNCSEFELDKKYDLMINNNQTGSIQFKKSGNIACMYIDTISGSMENIYNDIEHKERVSVKIIDENGEINYSGNDDRLKGRGNSTWRQFDKKPFSLSLKMPADLLGSGAGDSWALLANSKDITNVKNKLIYDFSEDIGLCAPESKFIDLYLNGRYNGLYLLSEKAEEAFEKKYNADGDYLFLRDWSTDKFKYGFMTENRQPIGIKYPKECSDAAVEKLKTNIAEMENALSSEGAPDKSASDWTEYIDIESWAKKYLIEEVFANTDAVFGSQYFYWRSDAGKKMIAGLVWDYDGVMILQNKKKNPKYFYCNRTAVNNRSKALYWYNELYNKKEFYNRLIDVYKKDFLPHLDDICNEMDRLVEYTSPSASMDRLRWPEHHNGITVDSALDASKTFLADHISFLNSAWIDHVDYHTIIFDRDLDPDQSWFSYVFYTAEDGKVFTDMPSNSELNMPEDTVWYNKETGELFDPDQAVTGDLMLVTKPDNNLAANENEKADTGRSKASILKAHIIRSVQLVPIVVLCVILIILFMVDVRRNNKGDIQDE